MFRKRGFVVSQAMLYAFGLVTVVIIFFWGYKSLTTFSTANEMSGLNSFRLKFLSDMETLSIKKDSIREFNYIVPSVYDKFCVFDLNNLSTLNSTIMTYYPLLKEGVLANESNVFLVGKNKIYPFKSDFVVVKKYPHYYCSPIYRGDLKFSAKGTTYNGEITTQILMDTIAKVKLTNPISGFTPTAIPNEYLSTTKYQLFSTDGFAYVEIPMGTKVKLSPNKDSISLEVTYPVVSGALSENYIGGPNGTTFSTQIIFGVKLKETPCEPGDTLFDPEDDPDAHFKECTEEGFALFEKTRFN